MKRRNKEFGIYLTLGMSKRKIATILFIETLLIGLISLIVGLGIGVILSQFMSLLVANMFEANLTNFQFVFSPEACIKSLTYFGIMYLIVMFLSTYNVSRCKLIDLIHGNKKSEKVKLKNPLLCIIVFIIAASMLGYAYYLVTDGFMDLATAEMILLPIALGCISTFLIFWSLSGLILKIVSSFKSFYHKNLNSFTFRQLSSKINTTVFSMTIICLMLFVTICVFSSALSIKNSMTANLDELSPIDIYLEKDANLKENSITNRYTKEQIANSQLGILETFNKIDPKLENNLKDIVSLNLYKTPDLTFKDSLGSSYKELEKKFKLLDYDSQETIIKLSDYNKIAKLYGHDTYELQKDEYIIVADFESMVQVRNIALKNKETIEIFEKTLHPKYTECQNGFLSISSNHINAGLIIIPDEIADDDYIVKNVLAANYKATSKEEKLEIEEMFAGIPKNNDYIIPDGTTRLSIAEASVGLGGMVTFIGLYIGIVFLISSAAILALKELSESTDNKERFLILRKIGTDEKIINKALFNQIGIFFAFPLIFAVIHSIFGIRFCMIILETLGKEQLFPSIIMTAVFIILIYGGYFIITYTCSKNIIKEK